MAAMSWYMAALTTMSIGAMTPYLSDPRSRTSGSDTLGSNMTALGVTSNTPLTTPYNKSVKERLSLTKPYKSNHSNNGRIFVYNFQVYSRLRLKYDTKPFSTFRFVITIYREISAPFYFHPICAHWQWAKFKTDLPISEKCKCYNEFKTWPNLLHLLLDEKKHRVKITLYAVSLRNQSLSVSPSLSVPKAYTSWLPILASCNRIIPVFWISWYSILSAN